MTSKYTIPGRMHRRRQGGPWLLAALAIGLLSGCSSLDWQTFGSGNLRSGDDQATSKALAIQRFEERRNSIELLAAQAALDRGDHTECERALRAILERAPAHRDARLLLAETMMLTGRRPEAFTQMQHALRDHTNDARVHHAMALMLEASGRHDEAGQYYARAAELNPDDPAGPGIAPPFDAPAASPPGEVMVSDGGITAGEPSVCPVSAAGLTTTEEQPPPESISLARADTAAVTPTTASIGPNSTFELSLLPAAASLFHQGRMALMHGATDSATAHFTAASEADPHNPQIPIHAAILALEQNYPTVAVGILKPAAGRFSDSTKVHLTLGTAYYRLGDYASSQVALRQALSLDNSNGLAYVLMGCTLEKLGQPEAAHAQWERAAALDPRYRNLNR